MIGNYIEFRIVSVASLVIPIAGQQTECGHAAAVGNGYLPVTSHPDRRGPVTVKVPKVNSRSGDPITFHTASVPLYSQNPFAGSRDFLAVSQEYKPR